MKSVTTVFASLAISLTSTKPNAILNAHSVVPKLVYSKTMKKKLIATLIQLVMVGF